MNLSSISMFNIRFTVRKSPGNFPLKAITAFFVISFLTYQGIAQQELSNEEKMFSPEELHTDLDSLYIWINSTHPDLYFSMEKANADKNWERVRKNITAPMSRLEFAKVVSPLLTQYKDGHLNLGGYYWEDEEFQKYMKSGGRFFPLNVKIKDGKINVIKGPEEGGIKAGAQITGINGVDAQEIISRLSDQLSGETSDNIEATISRLFNTTLWYIYGWGQESKIRFIPAGEKQEKAATLLGLEFEEVLKYNFPKGNKKLDLLLFEKENLAIIETLGFVWNKQTIQYLDSVFTVIKDKSIQHLAVDVRQNGGGNSAVGNEILKYLTQKPYSQAVKTERLKSDYLLSKPYNQWIMKVFENPEYKNALVNNRLIFENEPPVAPELKKPELFFDGKFYLITGPQTFSSAHMMAAAVKEFELGIIIGENTGSRMNFFGEPAVFYLPNTKIPGWIPTVKHWMPGFTEKNKHDSVEPDILIEPGPQDLAEGKDPVLEYLKSQAAKKQT